MAVFPIVHDGTENARHQDEVLSLIQSLVQRALVELLACSGFPFSIHPEKQIPPFL